MCCFLIWYFLSFLGTYNRNDIRYARYEKSKIFHIMCETSDVTLHGFLMNKQDIVLGYQCHVGC